MTDESERIWMGAVMHDLFKVVSGNRGTPQQTSLGLDGVLAKIQTELLQMSLQTYFQVGSLMMLSQLQGTQDSLLWGNW
jgi:hypothetical protein